MTASTDLPELDLLPQANPLAAVIEIGSSSLRMMIAQVSGEDDVRILDNLTQSISLGSDVFTKQRIKRSTVEECVDGLKSFCRLLDEYGVDKARRVRAIATSAVREASNSQVFLDRIYMTTHLAVEVMDEAETNRFSYHVIEPYLNRKPLGKSGQIIAIEVGAGSTDLLVIQKGKVTQSNEYRLGSLRVLHALPPGEGSDGHVEALRKEIQRSAEHLHDDLRYLKHPSLLMLGGEVRLAAAHLCEGWGKKKVFSIPVKALRKFCDRAIAMSLEERVSAFKISYPDAETMVPSLMMHLAIARQFGLETVHTIDGSVREGILRELALQGSLSERYLDQVYSSALELSRKFGCDLDHCQRVTALSQDLFDLLRNEHELGDSERMILTVAGLLHDVGLFISPRSHHKHSRYLILNSDVFGLSAEQQELAALVARYHRKAHPVMQHGYYAALSRENRSVVSKLAAILRVADALERPHAKDGHGFEFVVDKDSLTVRAKDVPDSSVELRALSQKGALFEEVYGLTIHLVGTEGVTP